MDPFSDIVFERVSIRARETPVDIPFILADDIIHDEIEQECLDLISREVISTRTQS